MIPDGKYGYYFHKWDNKSGSFDRIRRGEFVVQGGQIVKVDGAAQEYLQVGPVTPQASLAIHHSMQSSYCTVEKES